MTFVALEGPFGCWGWCCTGESGQLQEEAESLQSLASAAAFAQKRLPEEYTTSGPASIPNTLQPPKRHH